MQYESTLQAPAAGGRVAIVASWACQLVAAAILAQTLFFKLTYAPETRIIFARLGGRPAATLAAVMELACVVLLLLPRTAILGALLSLGVIAGAIGTHVFVIGVQVVDPATGRGDGGLLFGLAVAVAVLSLVVLALRRQELVALLRRFV
jgi:hypothetical protein